MATIYKCALCTLTSANPTYQTTHVCQVLLAQTLQQATVVTFQPLAAPVTAQVTSLQSSTAT